MEIRPIDANEIVKVAEHAYDEWNLAMAGAETNREINKVFKMQELCRVVEAVAKNCKTLDCAPVVHAKWKSVSDRLSCCTHCRNYWIDTEDKYDFSYCPHCGAKMDLGG